MRGAVSCREACRCALLAALIPAACTAIGADALHGAEDLQLCAAYGEARDRQGGAAKAGILRRRLLSDREWQAVAEGTIFVGMTACGLLAARGDPRPEGAIERLGFRTGPYLQWVYRSDPRQPPLYVYTDNGRIIGWQQ